MLQGKTTFKFRTIDSFPVKMFIRTKEPLQSGAPAHYARVRRGYFRYKL